VQEHKRKTPARRPAITVNMQLSAAQLFQHLLTVHFLTHDTRPNTSQSRLQDQVVSYARKEPGLLSWNVSTLLNRMMAVRQMLQLPPELALSLLAFNRPLLNNLQNLPQKLQVLQEVLGITGAQTHTANVWIIYPNHKETWIASSD
jgi:hypothetical protein